MNRKKAEEIVDKTQESDRENAIKILMDFTNKGLDDDPSPTAPSGSIPVYKKPNKKQKRKKKPGRKKGHPGLSRKIPDHIDEYK